MSDKSAVLKRYFGYDSFRGGQEPIIDSILAGRDVLAVMPTGAGKSLCYQIPAILSPGITLVISPLISLMKDQVGALNQRGIPAAYLNSSLTPRQYALALERASAGAYRIIYVAPERLMTEGFLRFSKYAGISLIAVDEAHCVSQWGHDFRRSYTDISAYVSALPSRPVVAAFTATATEKVKADIRALLGLRDPYEISTGFDRPNLYFSVVRAQNRIDYIKDYLERNSGKSGIIYAMTRSNVEEIWEKLSKAGFRVTMYHAGLDDKQRAEHQDEFIRDKKPVMVATNAFGMGIDKPDVEFIIHYNFPLSMESYYQEAGRAGRDGSEAECILLYSAGDIRTARKIIDKSPADDELDAEGRETAKKARIDKLEKMIAYCETTTCLRAYILKYFGERPAMAQCGKCSSCNGEFEVRDVTKAVRAIYMAIYSTGERFGAAFIADFLSGDDSDGRMESRGFNEQPGFAVLADMPKKDIREIIGRLIDSGMLARSGGDYPVLELTPVFDGIYNEKRRITMKFRRDKKIPARKAKKSEPVGYVAPDADEDSQLYKTLRGWRREMAERRGIPAYCIFTDSTLRLLTAMKPRDRRQLSEVKGVGDAIIDKYGEDILRIIGESYENEN